MNEISTFIIGDIDRPEFCGARATLQSLGRVSCFAAVESAAEALAAGEILPHVIVFAQAFPGQVSHQAVDRLRRLAPLGRVLGLLGSWCEGETRSGHPWPAAVRIYWHQWNVHVQRELQRLAQGQCPSWGLPVTATEEERLLQSAAHIPPRRRGLIAIHARLFVIEDWLSAACRLCGYSTVWLRPAHDTHLKGAAAAIFAASDLHGEELEQLRRLTKMLSPAPVIVLLDFPRIEDQRRALGAGATTVLSKPLGIDDLFWQLERLAN